MIYKNVSYFPIVPPHIYEEELARARFDVLVVKHLHKFVSTDPSTLCSWSWDGRPPFSLCILGVGHFIRCVLQKV
jgi:hypothetical protein